MSYSDRRTVLSLLALMPLAACGFRPAYGPAGAATGLLDRVAIDAPGDKDGFDLVERLEERLGRPSAARFRLSFRIETTTETQAIAPDNAITRYRVKARIAYALHPIGEDRALTAGSVSSFTTYSAVGTSVATASARDDARTRLMRLLADQIVTRLIATSDEWNGA